MYKLVKCSKDCSKCTHLNVRTDDKGYPFGYECLKFGDSVFEETFANTKWFKERVILTRSEAVEGHRKLWKWIAEENKRLIDADETLFADKKSYFAIHDIPNSKHPDWDCYACDYSMSLSSNIRDRCEYCPLDWSNNGQNNTKYCHDDDGLYIQFEDNLKEYNIEECIRLAEIIANLPERKD